MTKEKGLLYEKTMKLGSFYVSKTYKLVKGIDEIHIFFPLNFKVLEQESTFQNLS